MNDQAKRRKLGFKDKLFDWPVFWELAAGILFVASIGALFLVLMESIWTELNWLGGDPKSLSLRWVRWLLAVFGIIAYACVVVDVKVRLKSVVKLLVSCVLATFLTLAVLGINLEYSIARPDPPKYEVILETGDKMEVSEEGWIAWQKLESNGLFSEEDLTFIEENAGNMDKVTNLIDTRVEEILDVMVPWAEELPIDDKTRRAFWIVFGLCYVFGVALLILQAASKNSKRMRDYLRQIQHESE